MGEDKIQKIKTYKHNWYLKNKEKIKGRRLKRYYKNKKKELDYNKKYKKKNIVKMRKIWIKNSKDYRKKYPEKIKAHSLSQMIKIPLGKMCEKCNKNLAAQKHHEDYSKPYEIKFVCVQCHNDIHNNVHNLMHNNLGGTHVRDV